MNHWAAGYTDSNRAIIISCSTMLCGSIYLALLKGFRESRRTASEITSMVHHVIVIWLSVWCLYENSDYIWAGSVLSASVRFPLANSIQWINIGYFLYDMVNAIAWEHGFILHHSIALAGFCVSDCMGIGGLGNAVNTLIAEIGSVCYNAYNKNKSTRNYFVFVIVYASTRLIFICWTYYVFKQLWIEWNYGDSPLSVQQFICFVFIFQTLLLLVNIHFLSVHLKKASRILTELRSSRKKQ